MKTGILLVNLGSPDSPSVSDVRKYLKQFLLDGRVIDVPALPRNLLVRGIIAPFRAPKSAKTYASIWTAEGSPLVASGFKVAAKLQTALDPSKERFVVVLAMRYQNPSLDVALEVLRKENCERIRVIPLFPQYAGATTGSIHEEVMKIISQWPLIPSVELINSYPTHPAVIEGFARNGRALNYQDFDHILFSFHGLPVRQLIKADNFNHCQKVQDCCSTLSTKNQFCYSAQCHATAHAIAKVLDLSKEQYSICFQSRLGKTPWLQPYTSDTIEHLAEKGAKRVLVFCPAFVADCLETIDEIGVEYAEEFKEAGGEELILVPSLNEDDNWVEGLVDLATTSLSSLALPLEKQTLAPQTV